MGNKRMGNGTYTRTKQEIKKSLNNKWLEYLKMKGIDTDGLDASKLNSLKEMVVGRSLSRRERRANERRAK